VDWRLKCLAHYVLQYAPRSLHRALQRQITGRYYFTVTDEELSVYNFHVLSFRKLPQPGRALEFGVGSHLISALLLSAAGAEEVLAYDLSRIATVEQVNHVIQQLRGRVAGDWPEIADLDEDLLRCYRIRYLAPADVGNTGLPAASVDFFCSTSTLEHIPAEDIRRILAECRRLASAQALFSFVIDYHDHYCTADPSITRVNFYRYSESAWRFFNPSGHYQNRLRHSDYERLFDRSGLVALESRAIKPTIDIDRARLNERFRHYSEQDLVALNGVFTLRSRSVATE
jgi:hypothetical protein